MDNAEARLDVTARRFADLLDCGARAQYSDGRSGNVCNARLCGQCRHPRCIPERTCEYGLAEAFRWQGCYIYYCPAGLTFVSACSVRQGNIIGGVTLGPFLLGDSVEDDDSLSRYLTDAQLSGLPRLGTRQAEALSRILLDSIQVEIIDANVPQVYRPYPEDINTAQKSDITYKIKTYLAEHYNEKISLADIACNVYLSRTYVSTLFREETGCTIFEYLNSIRIDKACRLLRDTELTLAQVAQECGFEDQSYFTRVFKKAQRLSPMQYRKSPTPEEKAQGKADSLRR